MPKVRRGEFGIHSPHCPLTRLAAVVPTAFRHLEPTPPTVIPNLIRNPFLLNIEVQNPDLSKIPNWLRESIKKITTNCGVFE